MPGVLYPNQVGAIQSDIVGWHPNTGFWGDNDRASHVTDGITTSGSPSLRSDTAAFTTSDVGKSISIMPTPGTAGQTFITTILTFTDATHVVLAANAPLTLTSAFVYYGTDTTAAIQLAHDSVATSLIPTRLELAAGQYRCLSGLLVNISSVGLAGLGAVLDFSGIQAKTIVTIANPAASTVTVKVTAHGYQTGQCVTLTGVTGQTALNDSWIIAVTDADHFTLYGITGTAVASGSGTSTVAAITVTGLTDYGDANNSPNLLQSLSGLKLVGPGKASTSVGLCLANPNTPVGNANPGPAYTSPSDVLVRSFGSGVLIGSNCYINSFDRMSVYDCTQGLGLMTGAVNLGEKITFAGGAFVGNYDDFKLTYQFCDFYFEGVSFDFMTHSVCHNTSGGWVYFNQCHIEQSADAANWFYVSGSDSLLSFTNCIFITSGSGVFIQSFSTFYSATALARGGIRLYGCQFFYFINTYGRQHLVDGPGPVIARDILQWSSNRATVSDQLNLLGDGGFESSRLANYWTLSGTTLPVRSSAQHHSGTYSLLLATSTGATSIASQYFPISPGDDIYISLWYRAAGLSVTAIFRLEISYWDINGQLIQQNRNEFTADTSGWKLMDVDPAAGPAYGSSGAFTEIAPPGSVKVQVLIGIYGGTGSSAVYVDTMCINILGNNTATGANLRMNYGESIQVNGNFDQTLLAGVDFAGGSEDRVRLYVPGATSFARALLTLLGNSRFVGVGDGNDQPTTTLHVWDKQAGRATTITVRAGDTQGTTPTVALQDNAGSGVAQVDGDGTFRPIRIRFFNSPSGVRGGSGSPEGVVTAPVGFVYLQDDAGSTDPVIWFKQTGSGNTGWVAIATYFFDVLTEINAIRTDKNVGIQGDPDTANSVIFYANGKSVIAQLGVNRLPTAGLDLDVNGAAEFHTTLKMSAAGITAGMPARFNGTKQLISALVDITTNLDITASGLTAGHILLWNGSAIGDAGLGMTGTVDTGATPHLVISNGLVISAS